MGHSPRKHRFLMANLKPSQKIGYDVQAEKKVKIQNPKIIRMKNGRMAVKGTSPITGNKVYRILGK